MKDKNMISFEEKEQLIDLIKKGYDIKIISTESDVSMEVLQEYKNEIEDQREVKELLKLKKYKEACRYIDK